ncbi:hypothetical protein OG500_08350 [Kitasatospora sp. NBC_01250]|uniref:hypothetical protein n=1 Tax=unclassified Kitasatospora TaxID=2633591 RepID=UPI002E0F4FFA|nr:MULTISPECIES: hypothetical protein [unclassified Kitasatospora]WSJ66107.1 hypothetical protein OG294_08275 [Kitasatospora sp. NBC_01302]
MRARRFISGLSVLGLTMLGGVIAAPSASADSYGCAGNLVWSHEVTDMSGHAAGWVYDYWDGSNNCSVFVKSEYAGVKTLTEISITTQGGVHGGFDEGNYTTYAGPVRINGTGTCVDELVIEFDQNNNQIVNWWSGYHSGPTC